MVHIHGSLYTHSAITFNYIKNEHRGAGPGWAGLGWASSFVWYVYVCNLWSPDITRIILIFSPRLSFISNTNNVVRCVRCVPVSICYMRLSLSFYVCVLESTKIFNSKVNYLIGFFFLSIFFLSDLSNWIWYAHTQSKCIIQMEYA